MSEEQANAFMLSALAELCDAFAARGIPNAMIAGRMMAASLMLAQSCELDADYIVSKVREFYAQQATAASEAN